MPVFHYKGRNARGEAIEADIESTSADAVATQLFNTGVTPITIVQQAAKVDLMAGLRSRLLIGRPTLVDLILFARQMHTLMRAGVPIIRAMTGLADTARNAVLAQVLRDVVTSLEAGRDLAGSLSQHPEIFTPLFISIVQVGENSGRLDESFLQLSEYLELEKTTRDSIKSALRYPTIVIVAIAAAIAIINLKVIPVFAKVFAGFHAELPMATRVLIATSNFTVHYWYYMVGIVVMIVLSVRSYIKTDAGRYRWGRAKLRLPIVGSIILRATLARYARSFAMSTRSGVPLIQALTVVAKAVDNDFVADRILMMRNGIERGDTLTRTAAASGLFTPLVLQMLSVGEETGAVDEMLSEVAGFYEREVAYDLKSLSEKIEPIMLLAVGALVLMLALGVFLPMWDLAGAARGHG
jgi:MSHA biogenesis protein MshG